MSPPLTLGLDAATYTGTVALVAGCDLVDECEVAMRGEHEERLMPAVAAMLARNDVRARDLDRLVCGAGPGSFTSLRIAAAIAKGIAVAAAIPLYEASSLLLLVAGTPEALPAGRYLAVLDALRGESFVAGYEIASDGAITGLLAPGRLGRDRVAAVADHLRARTVGAGQELSAEPHARGVARIIGDLERRPPVEVARWEPAYGRVAEAQARWERTHGRSLENA